MRGVVPTVCSELTTFVWDTSLPLIPLIQIQTCICICFCNCILGHLTASHTSYINTDLYLCKIRYRRQSTKVKNTNTMTNTEQMMISVNVLTVQTTFHSFSTYVHNFCAHIQTNCVHFPITLPCGTYVALNIIDFLNSFDELCRLISIYRLISRLFSRLFPNKWHLCCTGH